MSLILNTEKDVFAVVVNSENKQVGTVSYSDVENNKDLINSKQIELEDGFKFELLPKERINKTETRQVLFISGESGSGKSYYMVNYCMKYKKMYPKSEIYLISNLSQDSTLDKMNKDIIRIKVFDSDFLDICLDLDLKENFQNSLVLFDDVDSVTDKKKRIIIYDFLHKLLKIGRHFGTSVVYCGHQLYGSNDVKALLNESDVIIFFMKRMTYKKLHYLLFNYFGLSKTQIEKIKNLKNSRAICYFKGYDDKIIISDKICYLI